MLGTRHEALQGWGPPHNTVLEGVLLQGSLTGLKASPDLVRPTQINLLFSNRVRCLETLFPTAKSFSSYSEAWAQKHWRIRGVTF